MFYNPKMNLCRDLAVLFVASYFPYGQQIRICDPMTGSGVRAARYLLEPHNVAAVLAADKDPSSVAAAKRTVMLNDLGDAATVIESDANLLMLQNLDRRFDLVDLDPFGSPVPFFESALSATVDGGILAATATDMGPLSGARPAACFRKYGIRSIRTEFEKELAVRILAGCLAGISGRIKLGITIVFAHATDHYARIYAKVKKGKAAANASTRLLGFLEYCPKCLMRSAAKSIESIQMTCEVCGSRVNVVGPIWLDALWDRNTVKNMEQRIPTLTSTRISEAQTILSRISEEINTPAFHYTTDALASALKTKPLRMAGILLALRDKGRLASRTHFNPTGFRTDASIGEISELLRNLT